jgi:large subunit ribosomal protein L6
MSKVGRKPIPVPEGVKVNIREDLVSVQGPKGELVCDVLPQIAVAMEGDCVLVRRENDMGRTRAFHGLIRSRLANMVQGGSQGFEKGLEVVGVGYRVQKLEDKLVFQLGYSHPVEFRPPEGVEVAVDGPTRLRVQGIDKAQVGQVAAQIRALRPPDAYKGKGVRYAGEVLRLKAGKAGKGVKKR